MASANRTQRRAQAAQVRHLKKQARGRFTAVIIPADDPRSAAAHHNFNVVVADGRLPKCLACSHYFHKPDAAAFLVVSNSRGSKAGEIPICKNCLVLRRAALPIFIEEVMRKQLGVSGFVFEEEEEKEAD